jgi:hypothetical protein
LHHTHGQRRHDRGQRDARQVFDGTSRILEQAEELRV